MLLLAPHDDLLARQIVGPDGVNAKNRFPGKWDGSMMSKPGQSFLVYFGAFGTAWTLLRDFGLEAEVALIVSVFAIGILTGLRLGVILNRRSQAPSPGSFTPPPEAPTAIRSRQ